MTIRYDIQHTGDITTSIDAILPPSLTGACRTASLAALTGCMQQLANDSEQLH